MIFSVDINRSTSVLGCVSPSGACKLFRNGIKFTYKLALYTDIQNFKNIKVEVINDSIKLFKR